MALLWFITAIVIAATFYAGYRLGKWRGRKGLIFRPESNHDRAST